MRKISVERRPDEKYYFVRIQRKGKRIRRCTYRDNVADARRVAAELVRAFTSKQYSLLDEFAGIHRSAKLGEIIDVFRRLTPRGVLDSRSQLDYISALCVVVREGSGAADEDRQDTLARSADVLSRKLAREFELRRVSSAAAGNVEVVKRSVARYLGQARAVFSRRLIADYKDAGLLLPESLESFLAYRPAPAPAPAVVPPQPDEIQRLWDGLPALEVSDPEAHLVVVLCLFTGLRRGELARLEWSWYQDGWITIPEGRTKNRRMARLPVAADLARVLDAWRLRCPAAKFVLPSPAVGGGGDHARLRAQAVFGRVNQWMRALGWDRRFTLHSIREYVAAWMRDAYGLEVAQGWMRHGDPGLTQRRYAGQVNLAGKVIQYPKAG